MKLELQDLTLQYNGKTPLFQELNLSLEGNDFVLIQRPSGSGKSSFLRLFNRLQEPTSGLILIDEKPASEHDVRQLRRRIGYVQQTPTMMPGTVRENLNLAYKFKAACTERIPDDGTLRQKLEVYLLGDVDLDEDATKLSVGQRQRIALIRTLLTDPEMILADEPTSALDAESRTIVQDELERLSQKQPLCIVLVTHMDFQLHLVCPRKFLLNQKGFQKVDA